MPKKTLKLNVISLEHLVQRFWTYFIRMLSTLWFESESESEVAQSCLTLSDPMDCSLPGSSIHGILQARVLEWGAIAFFNSVV